MATKFITVPIKIMQDKNLTANQKFILAEIEQLCSLELGCFAKNKHFSELIGVKVAGVSNAINDLEKKGYIAIDNSKTIRNNGRIITIHDNVSSIHSNVEGIHDNVSSIHSNVESKDNITPNRTINKTIEESIPLEDEVDTDEQTDAEVVANHLLSKIQTNKPNFKEPNLTEWSKDIDRAIRLDNRTKEQLMFCIDWIYGAGSFWIPNILSGKKLREKFDTMELQMMGSQSKNDATQQNLKLMGEIRNASN